MLDVCWGRKSGILFFIYLRAMQITKIISSMEYGVKDGELDEGKESVRRRYCKDVVIVSELFFKAWEGEAETRREGPWD